MPYFSVEEVEAIKMVFKQILEQKENEIARSIVEKCDEDLETV